MFSHVQGRVIMTDSANFQSASGQDVSELRDEELDDVSGGLVVIAIISVLMPLLLPSVQ
jgi:hypothetical protein